MPSIWIIFIHTESYVTLFIICYTFRSRITLIVVLENYLRITRSLKNLISYIAVLEEICYDSSRLFSVIFPERLDFKCSKALSSFTEEIYGKKWHGILRRTELLFYLGLTSAYRPEGNLLPLIFPFFFFTGSSHG